MLDWINMLNTIKDFIRLIVQDIKNNVYSFIAAASLALLFFPKIIKWSLFMIEPIVKYIMLKWRIAKNVSTSKDNYNDRE